ncbi:MAG TPA: hypothetical protein VM186_11330, partial [Planctomycetota bacterium]|nr:hypothetical protein [Planctomycetota bacterium]
MRKWFVLALLLCASSLAWGAVTTEYLGTDEEVLGAAIQGDWVGVVGSQGYHLLYWDTLETQELVPSYIQGAISAAGAPQPSGVGWNRTSWVRAAAGTTDVRAVEKADETVRAASAWYFATTGQIQFKLKADATFMLGVYMLDWNNAGRTSTIGVCDVTQAIDPPWVVQTGSYNNGKWFFTKVSGATSDWVSISLEALTSNVTASAITFDPVPTHIGTFNVVDRTSGSSVWTDEATVAVDLAAADGTPLGYQVTDTDTTPETWLETPPTTFDLSGEGLATVYGWIKVSDTQVMRAARTIGYSASSPTAISDAFAEAAGPYSINVTWSTDADCVGWMTYGLQGELASGTSELSYGSFHDITITNLPLDNAAYDLVIHANGVSQAAAATTDAAGTTTAAVIWKGGAEPLNWTRGANWLGTLAPANPTTASVTFYPLGEATDDSITTIVNPETDDWTIGMLDMRNREFGPSPNIQHTFDLSAKRLIVNGDLRVNYWELPGGWNPSQAIGDVKVVFMNGTLQVGTPTTARALHIGKGWCQKQLGNMIMGPDTNIEMYLSDLILGNGQNGPGGKLDLRGCPIVGGVIKANNIQIGVSNTSADCWVLVDDACGLTDVEVKGNFYVGYGNTNFKGFFGNPDTGYTLPADVNVRVGTNVGGTITRGKLMVGVTSWSTGEGKLAASSGGAFEAYVTDCQVGSRTGAYNSMVTGLLDLSQMDSALLDAQSVKIGVGKDNTVARVDGTVLFPIGGVGTTNTLEIGDNSGTTSRGLLDLPGASFIVNTALTMKDNAVVSVRVQGKSCGLQLARTANASVTGTANIQIIFEQPPDDPEAGIYYGL